MKNSKLIIFLLLSFLSVSLSTAFAMDYYVSAQGFGLKNGTTVQNAWAGFSKIPWGSKNGQVGPGSNLFICGRINANLTVGISGVNGNPLVIRGDCPGNPGIIDGANLVSGTWKLINNKVYAIALNPNVYGIVTEDDLPLVEIAWNSNAVQTTAAMVAYGQGTWSYDPNNHVLYVLTSAGDSPAKHSIEASFGQNYSTLIMLHNLSYVTLENLTIKNFGDYGIDISAAGTDDTVNNCEIYNGYNWAIFAQGITNMITSNNTIHHVVWAGHLPRQIAVGEAVRYMGNTGGSIYKNTFSYIPSSAIDLIAASSRVKVYGNMIHDDIGLTSQWAGAIYSDNAQNNYIYGNLIYNWMVGINISSETSGKSSSGNYVYNNVIYNSHLAGFILGGDNYKYTTSTGNFIYNNTIAVAAGETLMIGTSVDDAFENNIVYGKIQYFPSSYETFGKIDHNIYYATFNQAIPPKYTNLSFAQWQKAVDGDEHSGQYTAALSAIFVNPGALDFELIAGSKPIGAGLNLSSVFTTDFNGTARPALNAWDAGANQTSK